MRQDRFGHMLDVATGMTWHDERTEEGTDMYGQLRTVGGSVPVAHTGSGLDVFAVVGP
jgi:hypothetical protein